MKNMVLQRDTSLEVVMDFLRNAILDGTFRPGMQLKQSVIASQLGVSQGPTREALIQLASEGLVENIPFRGMFVRQLKPKDVDEIYQLRLALESLAVETALPLLRDKKNIDNLERIMNETIEAEQNGNYDEAVAMDLEFHRYIVELSGNTRLINFWSSLLAQSRYILRRLYAVEREVHKSSMASNHKLILEAIETEGQEKIHQILAEHMQYASSRVLNLLATQNWDESSESEPLAESSY